MKIAIDTHTHTVVSGHAYSTMREMIGMAKEKGLEGLAITEHAPKMPGSCHSFYFENMQVVPRDKYGIGLLLGTELNIIDEKGTLDLRDELIARMDIAIASMHGPCYGASRGIAKNTEAYIRVMEHPYVDIIGHPDDGRYEVDYEVLVKVAKDTGTLLEINNSSLRPGGFRENTYENDVKMLRLCKQYGTMVTLGSDAHVDFDIANYDCAFKVLEETGFPEELVANTSFERLKGCLKRNR